VAVSKRLVEGKREEVKAGEGENADAEAANNREAVSFIVTEIEEESEKETADQQGHQPSILFFVHNTTIYVNTVCMLWCQMEDLDVLRPPQDCAWGTSS
jgi:hypothetical protein